MTTEPEDSLLELALRGDLPSPETETRLRRRLLAAGLAIGNGVATTSAAAGSGGAGAAVGAGVSAKLAGLSWGIKVGVVAAVAIPTLGLWLDGGSHREHTAPVDGAAAPRASQVPPAPQRAAAPRAAMPPVSSVSPPASQKERPSLRASSSRPAPLEPPAPEQGASGLASQGEFALPHEPSAPQASSSLAEETRLLDGAFAALATGDTAQARALIAEHGARYPQGLLKKERQRAQVRLSELSRGE